MQEQLEDFYNTPGRRFIAEDYNAKHTEMGWRLIMPRRRELLKTTETNNLKHQSTGESIYGPSNKNKLPDLVDFRVT
jgi:hypothetical protein